MADDFPVPATLSGSEKVLSNRISAHQEISKNLKEESLYKYITNIVKSMYTYLLCSLIFTYKWYYGSSSADWQCNMIDFSVFH